MANSPDVYSASATLAEAALAFGLLAGLLIALADTDTFYPVAFGIAGLSLLYVLLEHPAVITGTHSVVHWATSKVK